MTERRGAPRNAHDSYFRAILEDPKRAADFLRRHLPPGIVRLLADEPPELLDGSFVDDVLRNRQIDRLFRVKLESGEFIFVIVEHASSVIPKMADRLRHYRQQIRDREEAARDGKPGRMTPILALVVYHGEALWDAPHSHGDVMTGDPAPQDKSTEDPELHGQMYGPDYLVRDIGCVPENQLAGDPDLMAGLLLLMHRYRGPVSDRILYRIRELLSEGTAFENQTYEYILYAYGTDLDTVLATVETKGATSVVNLVEELISKGRAEGHAEGEAKGEVRGRASILNRLLERRFGSLPATVRERVRSASVRELDTWGDAVLEAPTLEAVFEGPSRH